MSKQQSLKKKLIFWISYPMIICLIIVLGICYFFAAHEIEEVYDAQLVHSAKVLHQLTVHEIKQDDKDFDLGLENTGLEHSYERNLGFRIWYKDKLITHSANTESFLEQSFPKGFNNKVVNEHKWRFFVFEDTDNQIKVEVSERYDIRYELVFQLLLSVIFPIIFLTPVFLLIIWAVGIKVVKPLEKISEDVDKRSSDDLAKIEMDNVPLEISPIINALNRLFNRIEESFKREREFTDHAAHELRTPLAAMKTQTQVLLKKSPVKLSEGLNNLHASIDRATHMVEQLLSFSRLQNSHLTKERINLSSMVGDVIQGLKFVAQTKEINLFVEIKNDTVIDANSEAFYILLRNLIDNAIKYSDQGNDVQIILDKHSIEISDQGAGIPDEEKERVFNRFVRVDKTGKTGSGLGLSIVKWIADQHNFKINLMDNNPRGLKVIIHF